MGPEMDGRTQDHRSMRTSSRLYTNSRLRVRKPAAQSPQADSTFPVARDAVHIPNDGRNSPPNFRPAGWGSHRLTDPPILVSERAPLGRSSRAREPRKTGQAARHHGPPQPDDTRSCGAKCAEALPARPPAYRAPSYRAPLAVPGVRGRAGWPLLSAPQLRPNMLHPKEKCARAEHQRWRCNAIFPESGT